jgi:hypothetical protein
VPTPVLCVEWPRALADPAGGTILCHNDVCPDNVVFRDGRAAALIDFDLAAPGRPQGHVDLVPVSGFGDRLFQQGLEDAGVPPPHEAVVDRMPGAEPFRHPPPLAACAEPPDHPLELLTQPLGARAESADG